MSGSRGAGEAGGEAEIAKLRGRIDDLDAEIIRLLNERARCAAEIGGVKRTLGRSVYDPGREREILDRVQKTSEGPLAPQAVRRVYERILDESRRLERVAGQEKEGGAGDGDGPRGGADPGAEREP